MLGGPSPTSARKTQTIDTIRENMLKNMTPQSSASAESGPKQFKLNSNLNSPTAQDNRVDKHDLPLRVGNNKAAVAVPSNDLSERLVASLDYYRSLRFGDNLNELSSAGNRILYHRRLHGTKDHPTDPLRIIEHVQDSGVIMEQSGIVPKELHKYFENGIPDERVRQQDEAELRRIKALIDKKAQSEREDALFQQRQQEALELESNMNTTD